MNRASVNPAADLMESHTQLRGPTRTVKGPPVWPATVALVEVPSFQSMMPDSSNAVSEVSWSVTFIAKYAVAPCPATHTVYGHRSMCASMVAVQLAWTYISCSKSTNTALQTLTALP